MGLESVLLLLVGIVAGFLNVMAGGGSMLTVPTMIFLGIPGPVANGTNRIAIIAQDLAAVGAFARQGFSNIRLSASLALATLPGAIAGAWIAANLPEQDFNILLAVIMVIVMILMTFKPQKKEAEGLGQHQPSRRQLINGHCLMVLAGFWGGFIQIGVGFILMPILHRVMGLDLVSTNMHKVFIVLVYTVVALLVFASQLDLHWVAGLSLAVGMAAGGAFAARFQVRKGEKIVSLVLNLVLAIFIIRLLFFN